MRELKYGTKSETNEEEAIYRSSAAIKKHVTDIHILINVVELTVLVNAEFCIGCVGHSGQGSLLMRVHESKMSSPLHHRSSW